MGLIAFTVITVAFIAAIFLTWYFTHKSREEERRLLIEKGVEPSQLPERTTLTFSFPWLKVGCVIAFSSIGLLTGVILIEIGLDDDTVPIIGMFLFGGLGMIIAHYLDKPNHKP